jgi:hypothetical protein
MPPEEYKEINEKITKILESQARTETLLIGEDGSGLCYRVKNLEEKKLDKEALNNHIENHKSKENSFQWIYGAVLGLAAVVIAIFKK